MYLSQVIFLFSLGKYPEVGLLDPMVVVFFNFGGNPNVIMKLIVSSLEILYWIEFFIWRD